jgi:peroxiredoxin
MTATLCLIGCLLAPAQVPDRPAPSAPVNRGDWVIAPRLSKAQELVYRGSFTEEATGSGVQFNRAYRIESRIFILDTPAQGAEAAFLTVLKSRDPQTGAPPVNAEPTAESVRLELAHVDLQGAVTADPGVSLLTPLDGPPSMEYGAFVAVPDGKVAVGATWESPEEGRPAHTWKAAGSEPIDGVRCLKIEGVQKSDDWDKPRADRGAWRRTDTVWLAPRLGVASRVERVIERRDPAHNDPTYKSVLRYDLEEPMQYPGRLFEERQREITQAHAFSEAAAPLILAPTKNGPQLTALLNRIAYHLDHQPQTPYREVVFQVKRRVEAAQRGDTPPALTVEVKQEPPAVASLGAPAPDFLAPDLLNVASFRLRQVLGKPTLLVFYNPASPTASRVLGYAQEMSDSNSKELSVVTLSVSGDAEAARKQRTDLKVNLPLLDGSGLHTSYAVDGTPKLMLLDANGILRGEYVGWGRETASEVQEELRRWTKK